jgi:glutamyl endopeptidase
MSTQLSESALPVPDTKIPPFSAVGMLAMLWTDDVWWYGTGALIDNLTILTCSHNLIDQLPKPPGQAKRILFYPGNTAEIHANPPPGGRDVRAGFYSERYRQGQDAWDVGMCRLTAPYVISPPGVYFRPVPSGDELKDELVFLAGYPGPKNGEMWWDQDEINWVDVKTNTCVFTHDTWGGNSGSPVWTQDLDGMGVSQHAIHVSRQPSDLRRGVLITPAVLAWINAARQQPNPPAGTLLVALA